MTNCNASFAAADPIGRAHQTPCARRWLRTTLAPALLTIFVSSLAAQSLFTKTPGPNLVGRNPAAMAVADFNGDGKPDIVSAGGTPTFPLMTVMLKNDGTGNFVFGWTSEQTPLPENTLTCMMVGDFNGDGVPDILLGFTDRGPSSSMPLYLGGLLTGGSESLVAADFNEDGKLDFASVAKVGLSVQLGAGTGAFTESLASPEFAGKYIAAIDVNGDHHVDLVVSTSAGVMVLIGNGKGQFSKLPGSPFPGVGTGSGNLSSGDFNGDGKIDLASAGPAGVTVMLGDGQGRFKVAPGSPFAANLDSTNAPTAVADFNGDGVPDLALGSINTNNVTLLLNDGKANFTAAASIPTGTIPKLLAVADFNGDGLPDLAVQNTFWITAYDAFGYVPVLLMNATLTPNPRSLTFFATAGQAAGAAIPVAVMSPTTGVAYSTTSDRAWLKPSSGSGVTGGGASVAIRPEALQADQTPMAAGTYTGTVRFAKSDLSGSPVGSSVNVTFKVANPAGTLRALSSGTVGENPTSIAVTDFNGDGKPDLAVTNWAANSLTLLLGDGVGGYTAGPARSVGRHPGSVAVGDFDGDGMPDLAVANTDDNNVTVLLGDGKADFKRIIGPFAAGCGPVSLAVGDFNGDGKLDLAVQDAATSGSPTPVVFLNDGMAGFRSRSSAVCNQPTPAGRGSVAVGDFNGDGKLDLAAVSSIDGKVMVLLGDGAGNFTAVPNSPVAGPDRGLLVVEDFNGDGKQDLAVAGTTGGVMLLLGDGTGKFQEAPSSPFLTGFAIQSLAVGDFDGDGRPDLAVQDASNGVTVLVGDGYGNFTMPSGTGWFAVGTVSLILPGSMAVGDFNGDGRPDLAVTNNSGSEVLLLLGNPTVTTSALSTTASPTIRYGSAVTLTVSISNAEPGFKQPFGAVTLYDGSTPLRTLMQTTGTQIFSAGLLAPGVHTLSAVYAGNERNVGSTSNSITIEVILGTSVGSSVSSGTGASSPFDSPGLAQDEMLVSPNGKYAAAMQSDGNFVIYAAASAIWSTQTQGKGRAPYRLAMQPDGNLVIYGSSNGDVNLPGVGVCRANSACIATWFTGPRGGSAPYTLKMQDDGNLVMYDSTPRAVWFTGTQR